MTGRHRLALKRVSERQFRRAEAMRAQQRVIVTEEGIYPGFIPDGEVAQFARQRPDVIRIEDRDGNQVWPVSIGAVA